MERTIRVTGTGFLKVKPDLAIISMELNSFSEEYDGALEKAQHDFNHVTASLVSAGFKSKEIKTIRFAVEPVYESLNERPSQKRSGYEAQYELRLTFGLDQKRLTAALRALDQCQACPIFNVRFSVENQKACKDELLEKAGQDARRKAEILAKSVQAALGELVSIDYSWSSVDIYSSSRYEAGFGACLAAQAFEPDDIFLSDSATFVWQLSGTPGTVYL